MTNPATLDELMLAVCADEPLTIYGKPVRFEWPDGIPDMFRDKDQMREWAAERLAKLRSGSTEDR